MATRSQLRSHDTSNGSARHEQGARSRTKNVLLLEDDPAVREDLAFLIESRGYAVVTAANGNEAIAMIRAMREPPGLILLDLMMPVMDGWTFHTALRSEPEFRDIPIVVLSGIADLQVQADTLGAVAFLSKPFDLKRLWGILARICGPLQANIGGV